MNAVSQAAEYFSDMTIVDNGRTYDTRDRAIQCEIVEPIMAGDVDDVNAEYDVDALADLIIGGYYDGFRCLVSDQDFWTLVSAVAR